MNQNGLLEGVKGKGGGYRLSHQPSEITVGTILRLVEGNLITVSCLDEGPRLQPPGGMPRPSSVEKAG